MKHFFHSCNQKYSYAAANVLVILKNVSLMFIHQPFSINHHPSACGLPQSV